LNEGYTGNSIRTSKYNIITFLPFFLIFMFSRVAYLYFLTQVCTTYLSTLMSPAIREMLRKSLASDNAVLGATLKHALACERLHLFYKVKLDRQSNRDASLPCTCPVSRPSRANLRILQRPKTYFCRCSAQAALAWWSTVSPFSPYGPTIALVFVLLVAAGKAIIEDMKRHKEDRITNNSTAHVVQADGKRTHGALSLSSLVADRDGWRADHVYML